MTRTSKRDEGLQGTKSRSGTKTRTRRKIHPSVFRGRVHKAKGLMGKSCRSCDSFVKLSVTSDLHHSIRMKTRTSRNNKNPKYEENFTLCIKDLLLPARLLVSVFRRLPDTRHSRLIGCVSFGIGSLISSIQLVSGWFYLLAEEYGKRKHLRVTSQQSKPMMSTEEVPSQKDTEFGADLRKTLNADPDNDQKSTNSTSTTGPKELIQQRTASTASTRPLGLRSDNFSSYGSTSSGDAQRLSVGIVRGKDGFGFTICSDCPVKVQAVDAGGPAHQAGLRLGDSVLQLNGLPVETWKCADLAHAIRSCLSHITMVVWRGSPEVCSGSETFFHPAAHNTATGSKLLSHPSHSKHGRRWSKGLAGRSGLGALSSLWRDRKDSQKEDEEDWEVFSSNTTTLKGTRVTSSNGDNYIILSPVNPREQLLQPLHLSRNGTVGHLYQTHPSRGQNLLHNPQPRKSQPFTSCTSTLPPPHSRTTASASLSNHGNYQNCTIIQSHLPHSGYRNCVTLTPKTLIFPIFVQPMDLCSTDRTLLMSEEMILHRANLLPAKVTVLIYSDLLLLTREDEVGRCNVLQSPLYLNTVQLREVSSEPCHIYFLQSSQSSWCFLFSLEAYSMEQKIRVSLCLHDNIQLQLAAKETGHTQQLSDLPSLHQSDLLHSASSPYSNLCDLERPASPSLYSCRSTFSSSRPPLSSSSVYISSSNSRTIGSPPQYKSSSLSPFSASRSPVWKEREDTEEEFKRRRSQEEEVEERQQGEGESASESSENVRGVVGQGFLLSPPHFSLKDECEDNEEEEESDEEKEICSDEEFTSRPAVLRRSLSEGSLLQEPRSPRFLSDSTIHQLTRTATLDLSRASGPTPNPPSPQTLRTQLTKEGMSLRHMLLLLNGTQGGEFRKHHLKKKTTKSLVADVRSRLAFLRKRKNCAGIHGNSLEKALRNNRPSAGEVLNWAESLEALLNNQYGLAVFRHFLRSEFSEENLDFWLAVEKFKRTRPFSEMAARAEIIYNEFISTKAVRQVNVDSFTRESTNQSLRLGVTPASFQLAQDQIVTLMETDSYPRFLKSNLYAQLANHNLETASELQR